MKDHYKRNMQFYFMLIVWLLAGIISNVLAFVVVGASLLLLKRKEYNKEILFGFLFILILSDRLDPELLFAKSLKNMYIVMFSLFFFLDSKKFVPYNTIFKTFLPFFLFAVFCLSFSVTLPISIQKTLSYILLFISVPNYIQRVYREEKDRFLVDFLMLVFTFLCVGFVLMFVDREMVYVKGRYNGPLGNPNGLGLFTFLIFTLAHTLAHLRGAIFSKRAWQLFNIVLIASLILCGSRNSMIAVLLFLLLKRFYFMSPMLGFLIFFVIVIITELVGENFEVIIIALGLQKFFRLETLSEGSGRIVAWKFAWDHIQTNFFVGRGFGYNEYYMRKHYMLLTKLGHQGGVHNSFLTFWMDTGLIGLIIFMRSYLLTFIRAAKLTPLSFPIMFAVTFSAFFESWMVGSLNPLTIIFLIILTVITNPEFHKDQEAVQVAR